MVHHFLMTDLPRKTVFFNILITAWLTLAVICAGAFVIAEHDHVHVNNAGHRVPSGENCRICYQIQIALRIIEACGRLGVCIAVIGIIVYDLSVEQPQQIFTTFNPGMLKVKFNC